jgi:hypothetical protein
MEPSMQLFEVMLMTDKDIRVSKTVIVYVLAFNPREAQVRANKKMRELGKTEFKFVSAPYLLASDDIGCTTSLVKLLIA